MDGDGDVDIVSASKNDDTIAWYETMEQHNPSFTEADIATSADGVTPVQFGDIDSDGDLDVIGGGLTIQSLGMKMMELLIQSWKQQI